MTPKELEFIKRIINDEDEYNLFEDWMENFAHFAKCRFLEKQKQGYSEGYSGWNKKETTKDYLKSMLTKNIQEYIDKEDIKDLLDIVNIALFLWGRQVYKGKKVKEVEELLKRLRNVIKKANNDHDKVIALIRY